ncbi:hypothetical protein B0H14DRAFT_410459 [Mycena olivaceomarginata]|nr:hypothetical protein B0H14DRAFT_410459 [Mycena olivaceomarginata]
MKANPQCLEDATTIVSEFIYSLDSLPNEVAHLLQEIKEKEIEVEGTRRLSVVRASLKQVTLALQAEIDRDSSRYIRHSLNVSNSASSSTSVSPSPPVSRAPSPESTLIPGKISTAYAKIDKLSAEKCALAQRIIDLVSRTRARLDSDLTKVRALQGEPLKPAFAAATPTASGSSARLPRTPSAVGSPMPEGEVYVGASRNPASQIRESLRTALGASTTMPDIQTQPPSATPVAAFASVSAGPSQKKRGITAPVVALMPPRRFASPLTTSMAAKSHGSSSHKRSQLSRQIHPREEMDVDAEGEDEDENQYCFCQKQSYGDMIACDNDDCPYEWFHLSCVQLTQPTPEKWYCRECIENSKKTRATGQRKGTKRVADLAEWR